MLLQPLLVGVGGVTERAGVRLVAVVGAAVSGDGRLRVGAGLRHCKFPLESHPS